MRRIVAALLLWVGSGATAQPIVMLAPPAAPVPVRSAAQALYDDAAVYAARYGTTVEAAAGRLRAQEASVPATDVLAAEFRDRLAGIAIEHVPGYRIVVHLTGDAAVPDRAITADGVTVPIVFRTGAAATADAVRAAIAAHQADIRAALSDPPGLGVDAATGMLALGVGGDDADLEGLPAIEARIAAIAGVPVRAFVPGRDADLALAGGERLEAIDRAQHRVQRCTAGFLVTDGVREALSTAAHCPDVLDIVADDGIRTTLPMIGAWGAGHQDVQLHAVPGSPTPRLHAGADPGAMRGMTTWRQRTSLRTGDFVCHQGIVSGFSCAEIRFAEYAPPGDICYTACPATWVMVDGPHCAHGDSGGPVFLGTVAFGLVKGGSFAGDGACSAYYYMPLDYLPAGWRLLTATP
jgi:streptogrisin C